MNKEYDYHSKSEFYAENTSVQLLSKNFFNLFMLIITIVALVAGVLFTLSHRALYADGAYSLAHLLTHDHVFASGSSRSFAYSLTLFIPRIFSRLVSDLEFISFVHSASLFFIPCFFWLFSLFLSRKNILLFFSIFILFSSFFYSSMTFALGTHNILYGICIFLIVVGMRKEKLSPFFAVTVLFLSIILIKTYEMTAIYYPLLFYIFTLKYFFDNTTYNYQNTHFLSAFLYISLFGIYAAVDAYFFGPYGATRSAAFQFSSLTYYIYPTLTFSIALSILLIIILSIKQYKVITISLCLPLFIYLLYKTIIFSYSAANPWFDYTTRIISGYIIFLFFVAYSALRQCKMFSNFESKINFEKKYLLILIIPFVLFLANSIRDMRGSFEHQAYIASFSKIVNAGEKEISIDAVDTSQLDRKWSWAWTFPINSQLLRKSNTYSIIANTRDIAWEEKIWYSKEWLNRKYVWAD